MTKQEMINEIIQRRQEYNEAIIVINHCPLAAATLSIWMEAISKSIDTIEKTIIAILTEDAQ